MQFFIAEKLGMTLVELRGKMSLQEMYGWNAYFSHKAEEEEKAYEDAKRRAQTRKVR
tara:strand:+ start:231 stop:401 length:171 start_codon:yes stop_codon:yes gene_type:complete